jgi:hypothetical protein
MLLAHDMPASFEYAIIVLVSYPRCNSSSPCVLSARSSSHPPLPLQIDIPPLDSFTLKFPLLPLHAGHLPLPTLTAVSLPDQLQLLSEEDNYEIFVVPSNDREEVQIAPAPGAVMA